MTLCPSLDRKPGVKPLGKRQWRNRLAALVITLRPLIIGAILLHSGKVATFGKERIDFSNYDVSLSHQIVSRIQDKVSARLGKDPSTRDRYFIIPFAYQNEENDPEYSHSFITVIRVLADGRKPNPQSELMIGRYGRWRFEAYNISWIPHDFLEYPNLCVFKGPGSRLFPRLNTCPLSIGKNFNLWDTIAIATNAKVAVCMWGPYEVSKEAFDLGVKRKRLLDSGRIKYRADDRLYRENQVAINCFHAMASLDEPFPNGGAFGTGFKMWGVNGTTRVLLEYTTRVRNRGMLFDKVDVKRDRYGFVYAPNEGDQHVFNPFKNASAYRR